MVRSIRVEQQLNSVELGYNFDGLYLNLEDQQRLLAMKDIDREAEFDERTKK